MDILQGFNLPKRFRLLSDAAKSRVWFISPYIGRWPAIQCLIGDAWWTNKHVDFRLITDITEFGEINLGTMGMLSYRGPLRSILGVHAKIYIFDNDCIVTSANLTETAFTRRREVGIHLGEHESKDTISLFEAWWKAPISIGVSEADIAAYRQSKKQAWYEEHASSSTKLPKLWELPQKPVVDLETGSAEKAGFYAKYLQTYRDFANLYSAQQRLWPDTPLYLETDAFLNYLFHEGGGVSQPYANVEIPRDIKDFQRQKELELWTRRFADWLRSSPGEESWRANQVKTVRAKLNENAIGQLGTEEVGEILECIHAMRALPWPKQKFLASPKNDINTIRRAWKNLLFGGESEEVRLKACQAELEWFGPSSSQELLGCFYPDLYPLKNTNSDAGLKYFGYSV